MQQRPVGKREEVNETRCKNRGKKAKEQNALMRCILKRGEKRSASAV